MKPAIRVADLSKQYRLGTAQAASYRTLRESLSGVAARAWQRFHAKARTSPEAPAGRKPDTLWALRDVSFDIPPGEVVGIIGGNGAGKSTLLKILSRVTEPTSGRVEIRGRVGSLLEVGTGFHSELTGRENIYLSGAILGMTRREIARKFDDIVAFAEVEKFLNTPVKRYSSGMYVRLAFAVAAHLEPEILIVDEVLAVGDAQFQKKCLGKMEDISRCGRTVLFVSHNMNVIQRLCREAVLLEKGSVKALGATPEMVTQYLQSGPNPCLPGQAVVLKEVSRRGTQEVRFTELSYTSRSPKMADQPFPDGPLDVTVVLESDRSGPLSDLGIIFLDRFGTRLVNADIVTLGTTLTLRPGRNQFTLRIAQLHLVPGLYTVSLWAANPGHLFDHVEVATQLEVVELADAGFGHRPCWDGAVTCIVSIVDPH
jgi:ABC-type polysaccharide/polyol phosphate transport system ATPase subunit